MGIVIPFPDRRERRPHVVRRRKPLGVLDVPPRGEAALSFEAKAITRVERLIFSAGGRDGDRSQLLLVEALSIDEQDMLLGTVPLSLLRGSHLDLPTMNEGAEFRLAVSSIATERVVLTVRVELVQIERRGAAISR